MSLINRKVMCPFMNKFAIVCLKILLQIHSALPLLFFAFSTEFVILVSEVILLFLKRYVKWLWFVEVNYDLNHCLIGGFGNFQLLRMKRCLSL